MSDSEALTGGCQCGAVRFAVSDLPHYLHACHCTTCRRISGSATMSLTVPASSLRIEGEAHVVAYVSSDWAARSFCGRCGTGLWQRLTVGDSPADYFLSAGTLDDPSGLALTQEIYVDRKPDGYAFAGDHPRLTGAEFEATLDIPSEE